MKQALIALVALVLLASCEQKTEEATTADTEMTADENPNPLKFEEYLIPEDEGNTMIQRYHDYLIQSEGIAKEQLHEKHLSFLVDAEGLRTYLASDANFSDMVFYLAMDDQNKLTLVYVGAERDSMNVIVEKAYEKADGNSYLMDQIVPCPTCDRDRVHTNQ